MYTLAPMRTPFFAPESCAADGFLLRAYHPDDGPAVREATLASREHLRPWMPWAVAEEPPDETEARVRRFAASYLTNEDFVIGAWMGEELVGGTGFHLRCGPLEWGCAEIGMWVRASRAGQGLGTRILAAMLDWGFLEWGWERLVWKCDTRNLASARVAEKCGLVREATFRSDALGVDGDRRDTHLYAILRSERPAPLSPPGERGRG